MDITVDWVWVVLLNLIIYMFLMAMLIMFLEGSVGFFKNDNIGKKVSKVLIVLVLPLLTVVAGNTRLVRYVQIKGEHGTEIKKVLNNLGERYEGVGFYYKIDALDETMGIILETDDGFGLPSNFSYDFKDKTLNEFWGTKENYEKYLLYKYIGDKYNKDEYGIKYMESTKQRLTPYFELEKDTIFTKVYVDKEGKIVEEVR